MCDHRHCAVEMSLKGFGVGFGLTIIGVSMDTTAIVVLEKMPSFIYVIGCRVHPLLPPFTSGGKAELDERVQRSIS